MNISDVCIILGIILMLAGTVNMFRNELKHLEINHYTLSMVQKKEIQSGNAELKKVCRFVFLADLHNNCFGKQNEKLLAAIEKEAPDFIICAGDMLVAKPRASMETAIDFIRKLSEKYPIYYGNGNHEYRMRIYPKQYGDMYARYKNVLNECKVHHLENESRTLAIGGRRINICGLEINRKYYKRFKKTPMENFYIEREIGKKPKEYTILIAHNPAYFEQYAGWGADLTLSGHMHGGVVRLPKLGGAISPQIALFPKYSGGYYKIDGQAMLVSRGLGHHSIPLRIFNRPELIVVDLVDIK